MHVDEWWCLVGPIHGHANQELMSGDERRDLIMSMLELRDDVLDVRPDESKPGGMFFLMLRPRGELKKRPFRGDPWLDVPGIIWAVPVPGFYGDGPCWVSRYD